MNINIINNHIDELEVIPVGRYLIEIINDDNDSKQIRIFNPENGKEEILGKGLNIASAIEIQNAVWESEDYFFPVIDDDNADKSHISIYKYVSQTRTYDVFYEFDTDKLSASDKRIKVFILSDTVILIQEESIIKEASHSIMGKLGFQQVIIDVNTNDIIEIKDENINNNGLNMIIPISPTRIMTKTGYSYLEDGRFSTRSEEEALIESIFIHTASRFIADLTIQAQTIDADLIVSTYFNQYILKPAYKNKYIYYLVVDPDDMSSESVFINSDTMERYTCKNEQIDFDDMYVSYVIDDIPYVKNTALLDTKFLNLKTKEFDLSSMGEEFLDIVGNVFILKDHHKNKHPKVVFYHYPDMVQITTEKGEYITGTYKDDKYYFYVKK